MSHLISLYTLLIHTPTCFRWLQSFLHMWC